MARIDSENWISHSTATSHSIEMETEQRPFPLTRLTSEVLAVANNSEPHDKMPEVPDNPVKLSLRKVLEEILRALANTADSRQYYFLARYSDENESSEPDPELDSCSL